MLKVRASRKNDYNSLPAPHTEVWKAILGISCCRFQPCTMFFSHEPTHPHCIVNNPEVIYRPFRQSCNYLFRSIAPKKRGTRETTLLGAGSKPALRTKIFELRLLSRVARVQRNKTFSLTSISNKQKPSEECLRIMVFLRFRYPHPS